MIVVADTSALYAAFDAAQPEHSGAAEIMERETLVISPLVLTELDHLIQLDLADAVGVVLADRYRTDCVFTLDQRDFRAIRPLTAGFAAFRLLPPTTTDTGAGPGSAVWRSSARTIAGHIGPPARRDGWPRSGRG